MPYGIHTPNPHEAENPYEELEEQGLWVCPTCGENPARANFRCPRCTRDLENDRLERESGR